MIIERISTRKLQKWIGMGWKCFWDMKKELATLEGTEQPSVIMEEDVIEFEFELFKRRHRDQEKREARNSTNHAVRIGMLVAQPCEICGDPKTDKHHPDYSDPLNIVWLCRKHHAMEHVELRREQRRANDLRPPSTIIAVLDSAGIVVPS